MRLCAFFTLLLWGAALPAFCSPAPPTSDPPLQVAADRYDFGVRSELDTSPITHAFILKAAGRDAVTVDRLQPSCHCTHAAAERELDDYGRFTIPAGQSARVNVTVDPADMAPGDIEKEVYIFINGESTPAATLHIAGRIASAVSFSPSMLDFGRIPGGTLPSKAVTITVDQRLLPPGKTMELKCSNPAIRVTKSGEPVAIAGGYFRRTYHVTVSAGLLPGKLKATLFLAYPGAADQNKPFWSIPISGNLVAPAPK